MYCPDTLKRLNDEAVAQYHEELEKKELDCDYCDKKADEVIEVYNPADALRNPPVEGAYTTIALCNDCREKGYWDEEIFWCEGCGEYYIINHSWDVVGVQTEYGWSCQKCAAENMEGVYLDELLYNLRNGTTDGWTRINSVPGKELIWEGEFSSYSDFPGYTGLSSVANAIEAKAVELGIGATDVVFPIIDHGYQFSVSLALYY